MAPLLDSALPRPMLTRSEPQPFVTDLGSACDFFTRILGFTIGFAYGDPPYYAQVIRDGARINLRHVDSQVIDPARRERESLLSASITLETADELKSLFEEFRAAGVDFAQPLHREPWGASTFTVRDPDGNLLLFASPSA